MHYLSLILVDIIQSKPPIHHDNPRFSMSTSHRAAEFAAVALVNESPTAATMSMSPAKISFYHFDVDLKMMAHSNVTVTLTRSQAMNTGGHCFTSKSSCFTRKWQVVWYTFLKKFTTLALTCST